MMEYKNWLEARKKDFDFLTLSQEPNGKPAMYIVHIGVPDAETEAEINSGVVSTVFINMDEERNIIKVAHKLAKSGCEIGYLARPDSEPDVFEGELKYLKQFFDIKSYWCYRTYPVDLKNALIENRHDLFDPLLEQELGDRNVCVIGEGLS